MANNLNMNVPVLMLDVRERASNLKALKKELKDDKNKLFQMAVAMDNELTEKLIEIGRADNYEVCRLAFFHSLLLQDHGRQKKISPTAPLFEAINLVRTQIASDESDSNKTQRRILMDQISNHCLHQEFKNYWALLPKGEVRSVCIVLSVYVCDCACVRECVRVCVCCLPT